MRRKKRNDVDGTATAKHRPRAISRVWQFPIAPTSGRENVSIGLVKAKIGFAYFVKL